MDFGSNPQCGTSVVAPNTGSWPGEALVANSHGTVFSFNSLLNADAGSVFTAKWRSAPIASDLPSNYKHLTQLDVDYRAWSKATLVLKVSQDGGNNYGYTAPTMSLGTAPVSGRATSQVHVGGAFPAIEITSSSTGYELHRLDVTLNIGGRR